MFFDLWGGIFSALQMIFSWLAAMRGAMQAERIFYWACFSG